MENNKYLITKDISSKVLFLGVSKNTKGGMTSVIISYLNNIENMQFIPTWKLGNKVLKYYYALQALIRIVIKLIFNKRIKIVHLHGAANASFWRCRIYINISKYFSKKIILHEHAADFKEFFNTCDKKHKIIATLNKCDILIVLSQSWKQYFISIGINDDKIIVLNNVVNSPRSKNISKTQDNKLHLLYLGEISKRKGCFDLLDCINQSREIFKEKIFLRIGGNVVDRDINAYIRKYSLQNIIKYEGWISGIQKDEMLRWADVYILPSYNEGLPIAILESMSYKHPIISTKVGGIPEVVKNLFNGILIEPGNIKDMALAINYYLDNPNEIFVQGNHGYQMVQQFLPEVVFEKLSKLYKSLI